jgi:hypothetical protein
MERDPERDWQAMCLGERIDPAEVRLVYERYAAYRRFTEQGTRAALPLERWFHFYHLEKTSEGIQAGSPVAGCAADGDAVNDACLSRPRAFLRVLSAYGADASRSGHGE